MASSSFSSVQQKYDVFLSFRGEDTGSNFASHLHAALKRKGIKTFVYDDGRGVEISSAVFKEIEESKISIIIFSKNYASSSWCLDELCKIIECKKRNGQVVVPMYYHVYPFDVRNQTGSFQEAFAKHEERFKYRTDKVQRWRDAMKEVAYLAGWQLQNDIDKPKSELIETIVKVISQILNREFVSRASFSSSFVQQKYEVFLSLSEDTRNNFTNHLHAALKRYGIDTFVYDPLERGEQNSQLLELAIAKSKISIIILSKIYVSSSLCLEVLCKILECKEENRHKVVPIFYHVDPSDVRVQNRSFEPAFAKHQHFRDGTDKMERWRAALFGVANLTGFYLDEEEDRLESEIIEDIVKFIRANLNFEFFSMASSPSSPSSSSSSMQQEYEVFLSLSEDTRNNFTNHLHVALKRYGIHTFDNYPLERGEETSRKLMIAIEESKISIIVLSENYVSSSWCLEELCKILECKEKNGQKVLPIFYHVDPFDVQVQKGSFEHAFAKHQERYGTHKVERWRAALFGVANLAGFYLDEEEDRLESKLIEDIIKFIWEKLTELSADIEGLVGMDSSIEKLEKLLDHMESDGVRIMGIWGMPGVGKTTTADVLFKHISCQFDDSYFLANVREKSMSQGLECLQNELLPVLKKDPKIGKIGSCLTNWPPPKKVLIVLDDVNDSQQVEYLIEDWSCFGPGSTIIITSRDRGVLRLIVDEIYKVEKLTNDQAIEFIQFAFGGNCSISTKEIEKLSHGVVQYADGIPLALKILGYFLYNEKEGMWDSALRRLEKAPNKEIHHVFSISYDGLYEDEKGIFLDVACFFKGEDENFVADILDGCGFFAHDGRPVLTDKFLITILNNNLQMHNLIQEMGREIVRQESRHPGERSRLWIYNDIIDVLTKNKGTQTVEGIFLNMSEIQKPICIIPEAFLGMCNLRLLKIYSPHSQEDNKVHLPDGFQIHSNKLAYLHWHCYPSENFPLNFDPKNLVELHMHYSHVIQLWEGTLKLQKLKQIDLSYSQHLEKMPDLSKARNLVRINLVGCTSLLEIPSIALSLPNLKVVYLSGCSNLKYFPLLSRNVEELHLDGTAIEEVPSEIQYYSRLIKLNMKNCKRLKNFPSFHFKLRSLEFLDLSGCSSLMNFPEISWKLKELHLNETQIEELTSSIEVLGNLVSLKLQNCTRIKYLPSSIFKLKSLEFLDVSGCSNLAHFAKNQQREIWAKTKVKIQPRRQSLPKVPQNLINFDAHDCTSPEAESSSFPTSHGWGQRFIFTNCIKLNQHTIWDETQLSIEQRAAANVKLYHKDKKQDLKPSFSSICICFPGSEIPKWFNCQNLGSSVTTQLPLYLLDHKVVGFTLCAVVAFEDYNKDLGFTVKCQCNFKTKGDNCLDSLSCLSFWDKSDSPRFIDSDHVFLGYDFNLYSDWYSGKSKYQLDEVSFEFSACDSDSGKPLDSCTLKKCGVCLLYAQDDLSEIEIVGESEWKVMQKTIV